MFRSNGNCYIVKEKYPNWGNCSRGFTSLGSEMSDKFRFPVTIMEFPSQLKALDYFQRLKNFELYNPTNSCVLRAHFTDEDNKRVVVHGTLGVRLSELFMSEATDSRKGDNWWERIGAELITTFRSVMLGLKLLGENDLCCGRVDDISVNGGDVKFTTCRVPDESKGISLRNDVIQVVNLMLGALNRWIHPYTSDIDKQYDNVVNSKYIPSSLKHFFKMTRKTNWGNREVVHMLDDPILWSSEEKYMFLKKVDHLFDRHNGREDFGDVFWNLPLYVRLYEDRVNNGGVHRIRDILTRMVKDIDKKTREREEELKTGKPVKSSGFYEGDLNFFRLIRLLRDAVEHYDDKGKFGRDVKGYLEATEIVDKLFEGACHHVRAALYTFWTYKEDTSEEEKTSAEVRVKQEWVADFNYLLSWSKL